MQAVRASNDTPRLRRAGPVSSSAIYLAANILNAAIPFALLPILTRYLSPAEYGEIAMFQALLAGLGAFVGLNVAAAAGRKYFDQHVDDAVLARFMGASLQIVAVTSALTFLLLFAFRVPLSARLGIGIDWVLWCAFTSASLVVISLRLGQWQVSQQPARYGLMQVGQSTVNVLLSLAFVVILGMGASGRMAAQVWCAGLFLVVALVLLHKDRLLRFFVWDPVSIKEALKFGLPLLPHTAGLFMLSAVDRLVIADTLGLADAGTYMVAAQLSLVLALLFDAANKAYVPWLFETLKHDDPVERRRVVRYTYLAFGCVLVLAALTFAIAPGLVVIVAGPQYRDGAEAIGWLALGQAFGGMYLIVTNYVFFSKRTGLLSAASVTTGCFNVVLLLLLVPGHGIRGAGMAFAAAMAVRFLLTWQVAQRCHPMPWFNFTDKDPHAS